MSLKYFSQITPKDKSLGGKALGLAQLSQKGFPVPAGLIIENSLQDKDWPDILSWWENEGRPALAVRSSGGSEDSANFSFAGQNQTFLNVQEESQLRSAIEKCFASVDRTASKAYRDHFLENQSHHESKMNVVLQIMIQPLFSGVFFSKDPRNGKDEWLLETVPGYGEKLVSGKVTPGQISQSGRMENIPPGFTMEDAQRVASIGLQVAASQDYPLDMEWGMDNKRKIFVLQSRPITTLAPNKDFFIQEELERLEKQYSAEALWDGQTFSEWSGFPSYFTFSIWKSAFSPQNAFGNALSKFGYQSFAKKEFSNKFSLLERVFGRAYINLDRLSDLYYGPIPYKIEPHPRPHTKFDWKKISPRIILRMPKALTKMLTVAWNLSVKRSTWLSECREELNKFRNQKFSRNLSLDNLKTEDIKNNVIEKSNEFAKSHLYWPLVLVVLTESTLQRLQMLLNSVIGVDQSPKLLRDWLGKGLHTVTAEMRREYQLAAINPDLQAAFLYKFGHRCPGEMDLVNQRWYEIGLESFRKETQSVTPPISTPVNVEDEIAKLQTFKREVILEEWRLLKQMLELREEWKMEILKPYSLIRAFLVELGIRWNLDKDIHWLRLSEIVEFSAAFNKDEKDKALTLIDRRKKRFDAFKEYHFPPLVTLKEIKSILSGQPSANMQKSFDGEALSSGIVRGRVRIVSDVSQVNPSEWPEDTVLVAETTDPGWTPLFIKSKAVVIQNGGVLSHCAIVAREMGIPAVSGILNCHQIFKNDDIVWVDGNKGRVYYELA